MKRWNANAYFINLSNWFSFSMAIENTFADSLSDLADAFRDFSLQKLISCWIEWISVAEKREKWMWNMERSVYGFVEHVI